MKIDHPQIVATIGPASSNRAVLAKLIENGLDVVRFNCAWGSLAERQEQTKLVRELAAAAGRVIPIFPDLPGRRLVTPEGHSYDAEIAGALSEEDLKYVAFAAQEDLDYLAVSFVGSAADVATARAAVAAAGGRQKIIAKIERRLAVDNLDEIIAAADAVMVARGDLGNEVPLEQIPFVERVVIARANQAGKPVITATQMMLSMVGSPTPSRADVTDVAAAVLWGTDAVMLSEETTQGLYPAETVLMMSRVAREAARHLPPPAQFNKF